MKALWCKMLVPWFLLTSACEEGDSINQVEQHEDEGTWVTHGFSCMPIRSRSESSGGVYVGEDDEPRNDYQLDLHAKGGLVQVIVKTTTETFELYFDEEFVASGKEDIKNFETEDGTQYRLVHYGSTSCENRFGWSEEEDSE